MAKEKSGRADTAKKKTGPSQATLLINLAGGCELWHTPEGIGFIGVPVVDHVENLPIKSSSFRRWLQREYFHKAKTAANAQAIQDAIGVLEGKALFDRAQFDVHIRLAERGGNIYIDLCDDAWRVVEISPRGARLLTTSPVKFRRCKAMLPLPEPAIGGDVDELRQQLGVRDEGGLLVGWILSSLRECGPFPVLNLYAEQGAGKTTVARKIRALIDPNTAPMRSEPKEPRDLMIAANNGWLIALDNLSHISGWLSDALCRLSTGGGFSTRTLYENDEETIFDAKRPVIITGIEELATRGDLLDRSLIITLPNIPEERRRPEAEIWRQFDEAVPRLLGVLYEAVSLALRNLPTTTIDRLPRMADFALWATAAEPAIGLQRGEFMAAYTGNRQAGNELALESSPVGKVVLDFISTTSYWTGTASELLSELDRLADDKTRRLKAWPQSGRALSGILKRLAPNLRVVGLEVELGRTKKGRYVTLTRTSRDSCVTTVTDPENPEVSAAVGDARVTQNLARVTQENHQNAAGDGGDAKIPPYSARVQSGLLPDDDAAVEQFLGS